MPKRKVIDMAEPKKSQYDKKFTTSEGLTIYCRQAKHISYGATRDYADIKYIIIHYTGNSGDSSAGNANYFSSKGGNARSAGAQYFVDTEGITFRSIQLNQNAYAVGGFFTQANGAGKLYKKATNSNSVSIELCSYTKGYPSKAQIASVIKLIKYIQRKCPNAKTIGRHYDVNGKTCPYPMIGKKNANWKTFKKDCKNAGIKAKFA